MSRLIHPPYIGSHLSFHHIEIKTTRIKKVDRRHSRINVPLCPELINTCQGITMPRARIWGLLALTASATLMIFFFIYVFLKPDFTSLVYPDYLTWMNTRTYAALAAPIGLVSLFIIGTGFWIGFTILTIKVVPPMPEIVEKKDNSRIKAFVLCTTTLALAVLLVYGIYIRSYWALAVPATVISLVILGAVFWVGVAIITTRSTLPEK